MSAGRALTAVFRADASIDIGTGHVMRCLTLADALSARGSSCSFICGDHPGHLADVIRARGYGVHLLPAPQGGRAVQPPSGPHGGWLASSWEEDARRVRALLAGSPPDWLVLDHYAIDARWERSLADVRRRLLVIDDLADRPHECNLLLDQNLGRNITDYTGLTLQPCLILTGPDYALLRPEFTSLREASLNRRQSAHVGSLLVTMGGVDAPNATTAVLAALNASVLPPEIRIDVVMGAHAPWRSEVVEYARAMPVTTRVHVNPASMAQLMADSDLSIGAAGTTALERCSLGLPTLQVVLADNQEQGAAAFAKAGAAVSLGRPQDIARTLPGLLPQVLERNVLLAMSLAARAVTDGQGAQRVAAAMVQAA